VGSADAHIHSLSGADAFEDGARVRTRARARLERDCRATDRPWCRKQWVAPNRASEPVQRALTKRPRTAFHYMHWVVYVTATSVSVDAAILQLSPSSIVTAVGVRRSVR
jgi:hypothetical protein